MDGHTPAQGPLDAGTDPTRVEVAETVASLRSTMDSEGTTPPSSNEDDGTIPECLGRYAILRLLGRGGMGVVYLARDEELGREVALKVLPAGRHGEVARARLRREARTLAQLEHPHVVAVHDVGEAEGQLYLAMAYVAGPTLKGWLAAHPRPWREVLPVFIEAARGLAAAHAAGLVHRDFKPDNVLIDEGGHARVVDFGLARAVQAAEAGEGTHTDPEDGGATPEGAASAATGEADLQQTLTRTGAVMGTPAYMSPEQHIGDVTDAATDQFSFCVALWEGLYGERPFPGRTHTALAAAVLDGRVSPPPSNPRVPKALATVLRRGLSVDARRRWPDMGALIEALEAIPRRRRNLARGLGGLGLAAGLVGGTLLLVPDAPGAAPPVCEDTSARVDPVWTAERRANVDEAFARVGGQEAEGTRQLVLARLDGYVERLRGGFEEACLDTEVRQLVSPELRDRRVACLGARVDALDATARVLESLDREALRQSTAMVNALPAIDRCADLDYLEARLPDPDDPTQAEEVARARRLAADAEAALGAVRLPEVDEALTQARAIAEEVDHPPLDVELDWIEGRLLGRKGDYEGAVTKLEATYHEAFGMGHDDVAVPTALEMIYAVGYDLREPERGLEWARHAESLIARTGDQRGRAELMHNRAEMYLALGEPEKAEALLQESLALKRQEFGPRSVQVAKTLNNLSNALVDLDRKDEARQALEEAIAIKLAALGDYSTSTAGAMSNLGLLLWKAGEYDEAIRHHQRALEIFRRAYGEGHRSVVGTTLNLGLAYRGAGREAEALPLLETALADARAWPRPIPPLESQILNALAGCHQGLGDLEEAEKAYREVLALDEEHNGPKSPALAKSLLGLAEVANLSGEHEAAIEWAERILELERQTDVHGWQTADAHLSIAEASLALDERKGARHHAELARDGFAAEGGRMKGNLAEAEALLARLED